MKLGLPKFPKVAGTAKDFRDWDLKLKKEYPTRYAIAEGIDLFFRPIRTLKRRLKDGYWWVKYRITPKHKYTTIKLKRLDPGYYDADKLLMYFMFEIFEDFMKRQLTNPIHVWEYTLEDFEHVDEDEAQKEVDVRNATWAEMNKIYDWWIERPNRVRPKFPKLPKEWGALSVLNEDFEEEEKMKEWDKVRLQRIALDEQWDKEDEDMMIRLIKIRSVLWD